MLHADPTKLAALPFMPAPANAETSTPVCVRQDGNAATVYIPGNLRHFLPACVPERQVYFTGTFSTLAPPSSDGNVTRWLVDLSICLDTSHPGHHDRTVTCLWFVRWP